MKMEESNMGTKGKCPKQGLIGTKDLTIYSSREMRVPHHRLD